MNTTVAIAILAFWAVAATGVMIGALRSRADYRDRLTHVRRDRDKAMDIAERFKTENQRLLKKAFPARDGSDGIAKRVPGIVRSAVTNRYKPSSRNDTTDALMNAAVASAIISSGSSYDTSPSCDTSSSSSYSDSGSSSSDGGSCGGGE